MDAVVHQSLWPYNLVSKRTVENLNSTTNSIKLLIKYNNEKDAIPDTYSRTTCSICLSHERG